MTTAQVTKEHRQRIKDELVAVGLTKYGLHKLESKYLPNIIHDNEHIMGVAFGITKDKNSAMLIATDFRIIYLDRKPGFTITDEVTYDMVGGIGYNIMGSRAAVTLHTRMGDFSLAFVNLRTAEKFIHYVEQRRLEHLDV